MSQILFTNIIGAHDSMLLNELEIEWVIVRKHELVNKNTKKTNFSTTVSGTT
jgi:hypothetical protein